MQQQQQQQTTRGITHVPVTIKRFHFIAEAFTGDSYYCFRASVPKTDTLLLVQLILTA
jgi:hypothetical protein